MPTDRLYEEADSSALNVEDYSNAEGRFGANATTDGRMSPGGFVNEDDDDDDEYASDFDQQDGKREELSPVSSVILPNKLGSKVNRSQNHNCFSPQ